MASRQACILSIYIILHAFLSATTMDISSQGHDIILQHDVDTLLVPTDLSPSRARLNEIHIGIASIKMNSVSDIRNSLMKDQKTVNRAILDSIRADELSINFIK